MSAFIVHVLIYFFLFAILSIGCDLILGYTGLFQIGHGAFFAIGAYTGALLSLHTGTPFILEVIASAVLAGIAGLLLASTLVTVNPDYFALATFGFAVVTYTILGNWYSLTRGSLGLPGIPPVTIAGVEISGGLEFLGLVAVVTAIAFLLVHLLVDSPFGRALQALREDEVGLRACGRSASRLKILSYTIGVMFAGVAGNLFAHYATFIDPSSFTVEVSILVLTMVVIGGMGTLWGPVLGAFILVSVPEMLRFAGFPTSTSGLLQQVFYGSLLVAVLLWRPSGLLSRSWFRNRRSGSPAESSVERREAA